MIHSSFPDVQSSNYKELTFLNLACRVFVGTVSEFCVKHAECPVITIKRKPGEAPQDPADD